MNNQTMTFSLALNSKAILFVHYLGIRITQVFLKWHLIFYKVLFLALKTSLGKKLKKKIYMKECGSISHLLLKSEYLRQRYVCVLVSQSCSTL